MTDGEIRCRPATQHDLDAILNLLRDDALGQGREVLAPEDRSQYSRALERIQTQPHNDIIVAELDGEIAGTFQLTYIDNLSLRGGTRAQIEAVRVRSDLRGKGIGDKMMRWALDQASSRGCRLAQLTTNRARGDAATRFYERLGFEATHHGMKLYF